MLCDNVYEFEMAKRNDWQHDHVHLYKFESGILGAILGLPVVLVVRVAVDDVA